MVEWIKQYAVPLIGGIVGLVLQSCFCQSASLKHC